MSDINNIDENETTKIVAEQESSDLEQFPRTIVIEEAIEAILFAAGHPISYATLARVFEKTPTEMRNIISDYALKYNNLEVPRGVMLLTYSDSCQLCTKQHYLTEIRDALGIKKSGSLSTSALETLAIVAYNQPVTRIFVDTLRKVDSSYAMNSLIDRGLIECKGRLDVPGRPMLYGTTSDFLRCFGIKSIEDLPRPGEDISEVFANTKLTNSDDEELNTEQLEILSENAEDNSDVGNASESRVKDEDNSPVDDYVDDEPSAEDDIIEDPM